MANKGPKTLRGIENKIATGDGRKSYIKQMNERVLNKFERRLRYEVV